MRSSDQESSEAVSPEGKPSGGFVRSVARALLWPARRFFDPRFQGISEQQLSHRQAVTAEVEGARAENLALLTGMHSELRSLVATNTDALTEAVTVIGASLRELLAGNEHRIKDGESLSAGVERLRDGLRKDIDQLQEGIKALSRSRLDELVRASLGDLDPALASLLNRETTSEGLAAQRGLFFNPPVWTGYEEGDVFVRAVNERIIEVPFAFRGLADLEVGSKILDVGATESTLALSMASLGHRVTALDPRPYPLSHPFLENAVGSIEDWEHDGTFAAVTCLSTIEHIGVGAYGQPARDDRPDLKAARRMLELTAPGGVLVLTTRFGEASVDALQRTYDDSGLEELLDGWAVEELIFAQRSDERTWVVVEKDDLDGSEAVVLVKARHS